MLAHENSAIVTSSGKHRRTTLKGVEDISGTDCARERQSAQANPDRKVGDSDKQKTSRSSGIPRSAHHLETPACADGP